MAESFLSTKTTNGEDLYSSNGFTLKSLCFGIFQVLVVCLGSPYAIWVLGTSEISWSFFPISVGFFFVCLIIFNGLLKSIKTGWSLNPSEIITVLIMGLVTTGIPIFMMGFILSIPTTPHYFASAENQWDTYVLPNLPHWLLPSNEGLAMTWFFEGLPIGEPVPWSTLLAAWGMPMFWWLSFIWTLYLVCFCMVVILRKQWVERERLAYPLMEIPEALLDKEQNLNRFPSIFYNRVFWLGMCIPIGIALWNIIGFFFHFVPEIAWEHPIQIAEGFPTISVRYYFPVIGFMYFANLNITFSIWFFFLLTMLEEGLFNRFGIGVTTGDTFVWGLPSTSWQCWGAFVVLVLWSLWMARDHLKDVVKKAWNPSLPIDDHKELLSYRTSCVAMSFGLFYLTVWLYKAGMEISIAIFFLAGIFIAYLGITRLVVQTGVFYLTTPIVSQAMTVVSFGTGAISPSGIGALGLSYSFFGDVQSIFMPSAAHAARMHSKFSMNRRGLLLAIAVALFIGFSASLVYVVTMAYEQGASNFNSWFFRVSSGAGVRAFDDVIAKIKTPTEIDLHKLSFFSIGATAMSLLTFLQYRFTWWPLHPVGLAVSAVWMIRNQAAAIFIAWAAKSLIMRFGGIELYRKSAPFFIGLILGHFSAVGISFIVDMIFFPGNGHPILHG